MNIPSPDTFDLTSEFYEIGLIAAASPEFADKMVRALLVAGENSKAPGDAGDAPTDPSADSLAGESSDQA
jgi:hypothetical protein